MPILGLYGLLIAFAGVFVSVICFVLAYFLPQKFEKIRKGFLQGGHVGIFVSFAALGVCCFILVFCFLTQDIHIAYVVENQPHDSGPLSWLYKISGLWAGREGSLLFWAWLVSLFASVLAARNYKELELLDSAALLVMAAVLVAFVGVLLFSEDYMPFTALDARYIDEDGSLRSTARLMGMNSLLQHWAMAAHPPTLFFGYAGFTVPFAYALAALMTDDISRIWIYRCQGYTNISWFFLTIGIGLGAIWAYVVLGWGGYWSWDPVENASLLPWLAGLALIHSFTLYRKRGMFKRWSILCACIVFSFVILATFITRSGIVASVHTFDAGDMSIGVFLALIVLPFALCITGLFIRRKSNTSMYAASEYMAKQPEATISETESFASKEISYYLNNLFLIILAVLIGYLTLTSALPDPLPFAGMTISASTYESIARPLSVLYCLLAAVCPLLSWNKTSPQTFARRIKAPLLCTAVLWTLLIVLFFVELLPAYEATMAQGGSAAESLYDCGPAGYYYALTIIGFFAAALLFSTSLISCAKTLSAHKNMLRIYLPRSGGFFTHAALAVMLVGLIGSSMYSAQVLCNLVYDAKNDTVDTDIEILDYTLKYSGNSVAEQDDGEDVVYTVYFDVYKAQEKIGEAAPSIAVSQSTWSQCVSASVITLPEEDLFVVLQEFSDEGLMSVEVQVNPLIMYVWIGLVMMIAGIACTLFAKRA